MKQVLELSTTLITMITISMFLIQFHWIFVLIIFLSFIPILIMQSRFGADRYFLMKFQTPLAREQHYLFDIFTDRHHNKEIRLTNSQSYLIDKWKSIFSKNRMEILNQEASQQKKSVALDSLSGLSYLLSAFYLIWMIVHKTVRVGDFVSIVESIQRLQNSFLQCANIYSSLKEKSFYLNDLNTLMTIEEEDPSTRTYTFPSAVAKSGTCSIYDKKITGHYF
ncbi:hypothetical protein [Exiguobacterium artemiae]|uniref:hypothetical protein n=1 Tax=Exiguobacterium artemiae TaxID=340145 RepID=UPI002964850C|nr:hypothetical protein [Exiguobacterium sibiricum]MDW2886449.1 hypothetical protein [Exiguobacterium sibiricum]